MSFNGSGTFVVNSAGQPVVANTVISATVFNALTADLATGLSTCITKDGQTTVTANIPFGNNKITTLGAGTAASDAANLGQVQSTAAKLVTVTGTDTITGTMSPALTAYAAGQLFYFIANAANTGAVTINIDGLGAKSITRDGSTALTGGDINSGEFVVIIYDGTRFQMINAANSFGNTTINGTLTVTGNTALQANVSITSTLSVGGTFAVTGAATLGSTLAVTGKSDLPTVSTASINAAVALITTGTVTNLTASGASIASANIGNLQFTAASIASINAGVAVINNLTVTSASIASMNGSVANITTVNATTVDATNVEVTNVKAKDGTAAIVIDDLTGKVNATTVSAASLNAAVAVITTGTVTNLTSTSASVASANAGVALITTGTVTNLTSTSASIASANVGTAVITTGTLTNLTATSASVASANVGVALITTGTITSLTATGASVASANVGTAVVTGLTVTNASIASLDAGAATITTGNLTFSGTGQRITGDMSNATIGNRLGFQTSTTNGNTDLQIIPNGTSVTSGIRLNNNSDTTNAGYVRMSLNSTEASISVDRNSVSGTYLPLGFNTGGSERMRLDTSGNVGIGTASPVTTFGKNLTLYNDANTGTIASNTYLLVQSLNRNGVIDIASSATGTGSVNFVTTPGTTLAAIAGDIANSALAFRTGGATERMRIDSSGNVGIGTAPSYKLHVAGSSTNDIFGYFTNSVGGSTKCRLAFQDASTTFAADLGCVGNNITFNTVGSERMRIDSSGNVGIGTTSPASKLDVNGIVRDSAGNVRAIPQHRVIGKTNTRIIFAKLFVIAGLYPTSIFTQK